MKIRQLLEVSLLFVLSACGVGLETGAQLRPLDKAKMQEIADNTTVVLTPSSDDVFRVPAPGSHLSVVADVPGENTDAELTVENVRVIQRTGGGDVIAQSVVWVNADTQTVSAVSPTNILMFDIHARARYTAPDGMFYFGHTIVKSYCIQD